MDMNKPEAIKQYCKECGEETIHIVNHDWSDYICVFHEDHGEE